MIRNLALVSLLGALRSAPPDEQHHRGGELDRVARHGEFGSGARSAEEAADGCAFCPGVMV